MNKTTKGLTNIMCSRFLFVYVMFLLLILFEAPNITAVDTTRRIKRTQTINVGVERGTNTEDIHYSEVRMTAQLVKRKGPRRCLTNFVGRSSSSRIPACTSRLLSASIPTMYLWNSQAMRYTYREHRTMG